MSGKHTPGPWKWADSYEGLNGPGGAAILCHEDYEGMWLPYYNPHAAANASLIEAAPDLLEEACQAALGLIEFEGRSQDMEEARNILRAAIAKATQTEN